MNWANPKQVILDRLESIVEIDDVFEAKCEDESENFYERKYEILRDGIDNLIEDIKG